MNKSFGKQRGIALVVTLVLLVVALILGVTSYQNARLEETMAGNQRAASLALMAAEYGAADFSYAIGSDFALQVGPPAEGDKYEDYMYDILSRFKAWATGYYTDPDDTDSNAFVGKCVQPSLTVASGAEHTLTNSCYVISARGVDATTGVVKVEVDGIVHSGELVDVTYASGALATLPSDIVVSRRTVRLLVGAEIGESLSPLNFVGELGYYNGIDSEAVLEGEEIDGYVNPAVSVQSKAEAAKIVQDIIGKTKSISDYAYFVPDDDASCAPDCGVYHALDVVNMEADPPAYEGDYENCDTKKNNLCNYKGGIASKLGAPILSKPDDFDSFVSASVEGISDKGTYWMTDEEARVFGSDGDKGVYFVTDRESSTYTRPVWDEHFLRTADSDSGMPARMERPLMDIGGFNKEGVLIVDGDVEFDGNPEFKGLIIVLGDYTINGSGNEPFTGAIISAPYSTHYTDSSDANIDLVPFRDASGNLLDDVSGDPMIYADGTLVGDARVVSEVERTLVSGEGEAPEYEYVYSAYIVDSSGDKLEGYTPSFVPTGCFDIDSCTPVLAGSSSVKPVRKFDPVGVKVNGGGKQPYLYDYEVIQEMLGLLSDEAQLLFLVGQSTLNGYKYGLRSWSEMVVPPPLGG